MTAGRLSTLALSLLMLMPAAGRAQHVLADAGPYDPAIPTPASVLGYEIGDRFTPHHLLVRYFERVAEASPRVTLDTVAFSYERRPVLLAAITSEANQAAMSRIRANANVLGDPRGASDAELDAVVASTPSIVWLGYTVHGNEGSGVEAAIAMLYQLAAGNDAETRMILDSTVVLIDPVQNPDGHERHVQHTWRMHGGCTGCYADGHDIAVDGSAMIHDAPWPGGRTNHYLFDLNRDWFIHAHPESRGRTAAFLDWMPHVAVDLHEMGSNSSYFFAPPMEPFNPNVPEQILDWWDVYAAANAAAFAPHGWSFFTGEGYDEFYPGYGVSWPVLTGAIGMTYEQASSEGGAIRRDDGTILTLREAARHHYTAAWATALTTARLRTDRVRDYLAFRRGAIEEHEDGPMRAVIFGPGAQGRADSLAVLLIENGVEVQRLQSRATIDATAYGEDGTEETQLAAGAYVVDLAQPQGRMAKALLEPDAALDSSFIAEEIERRRTGRNNRFYDVTAWSLPLSYRVPAWWSDELPGPLTDVSAAVLAGGVRPTETAASAAQPARYGYAFELGSEAAFRLLGALLNEDVLTWYAPRAFAVDGHDFPQGAVVVRVAPNGDDVHETVRRLAAEAGASVFGVSTALSDEGMTLGSNSVFPIEAPRVALVGGPGFSSYSFGFAWFALDKRLHYPAVRIDASSLDELDDFDVLIVPSGDVETDAVAGWVRDGGTLITLDGSTGWVTSEDAELSEFRALPDSSDFNGAEGAIARVVVADTLSPLMAGVHVETLAAPVFGDAAYAAPDDVGPGQVIVRYPDEPGRVRLSGYLWPEAADRLAGTPYLWTEEVGSGRIIAFTQDPNFRDLWHGWLPIFGNAVLLGASMD